jgi:hypothetical protein
MQAKMIPLSTYMPSEELFQFFILARSGTVYDTDRTKERGEPCGTPTGCTCSLDVMLLNLSQTQQLVKKEEAGPSY